jgi:hypothetical protein
MDGADRIGQESVGQRPGRGQAIVIAAPGRGLVSNERFQLGAGSRQPSCPQAVSAPGQRMRESGYPVTVTARCRQGEHVEAAGHFLQEQVDDLAMLGAQHGR